MINKKTLQLLHIGEVYDDETWSQIKTILKNSDIGEWTDLYDLKDPKESPADLLWN